MPCYPIEISDYRNWGEVKLEYDSSRRLAAISFGPGAYVKLNYDLNGNLESLGSITYLYDSANRHVGSIVDFGNGHVETRSYAYNASFQLVSETTEVVHASGSTYVGSLYYRYPNTSTNNFSRIEFDGGVVDVEYDDKPNPLKRLGVVAAIFNPIYGYFPLFFSDNNVTKLNISGLSEDQVTFEYKYNNQGYPVQVHRNGNLDREYAYDCN